VGLFASGSRKQTLSLAQPGPLCQPLAPFPRSRLHRKRAADGGHRPVLRDSRGRYESKTAESLGKHGASKAGGDREIAARDLLPIPPSELRRSDIRLAATLPRAGDSRCPPRINRIQKDAPSAWVGTPPSLPRPGHPSIRRQGHPCRLAGPPAGSGDASGVAAIRRSTHGGRAIPGPCRLAGPPAGSGDASGVAAIRRSTHGGRAIPDPGRRGGRDGRSPSRPRARARGFHEGGRPARLFTIKAPGASRGTVTRPTERLCHASSRSPLQTAWWYATRCFSTSPGGLP